ncbi:pentapeptide repeat-containing protein [Peptostreptococcus faecalis]|uniref:pentapeptide repeat-containing protein n=1 Tax=Peptostreptococcus faecalis TaxID=2045015 RepID=UPI001FA81B6C|nr:pentapeptide repeat-containing protein [Peptostreptococcus faecalis]
MIDLNFDELTERIKYLRENKKNDEKIIDMREISISDMDLSGMDLSKIDFSWSDFVNVKFIETNFEDSVLGNTMCKGIDFSGSNFRGANLENGDFRNSNLSNTNCDETVFTGALLEGANLENLIYTDKTIHFKMSCPETGYFFGYKKCFNDRLVKLLIPKDAKRCSGTTNACRCDKAKTVSITNLDGTGFYREATSFVDGEFSYRLGEYSYADEFNDDRWLESTHGIHFWMSKEEALAYM